MRRTSVVGFSAVLVILLVVFWWWKPRQKPPPPMSALPVRGTVVDDEGRPVFSARVRWKGELALVQTDANGRFALPPPVNADATATAAKPGYIIGSARQTDNDLRVTLTALRSADNPDYEWVDPSPDPAREHNCGNCHAEIYNEWKQSGHARSASGERIMQLYASAHGGSHATFDWSLVDDYPEGLGVCSSCHAPSVDPLNPKQHDLRDLKGVAVQGVHCDYCHKIEDASVEHIGLAHGTFGLKLRRPHEGQLFFGPLDDVDRGEDAFAPVHQESRVCASCHEGTVFGVPVYSTYSEWLTSPAKREGKECQSCHMTPTQKMRNVAPGAGGIERHPASLASHGMLPGGIQAMLRNSLKVEATTERRGEQAVVSVKIRATNVGHNVPTGFIDRHLILLVQATDTEQHAVAAIEGPKLPATVGATWHNESGLLFARLLRTPEGEAPAPFWKSGVSVEDTRLVPEQPQSTVFIFPQTATNARVRLVYRHFWQQVADAKQWDDNSLTIVDHSIKIASP